MAVSKEQLCKQCGLSYTEDEGRVHGSAFTCAQCKNVLQTIRRNLGSTTDLQEWSVQETHTFFQTLQKEKQQSDGKLQWTTVRACLIKRMTEQQIQAFTAQVQVEELPVSVWEKRGWDKETILRFPYVESQEHGCLLYQLPVKKMTWAETFQQIEEKILEGEKQAQGKKNNKDLDVPQASDKGSSADAKAEAKALKKVVTNNEKIAGAAAKAMGTLTGLEANLGKALKRYEGNPNVEADAVTLLKESQEKASQWATAARLAVNGQSSQKALPEGVATPALEPLPFNQSELKLLGQQSSAALKALKASVPKAAAKPKSEPKAKAAAANKRKREKQAA